MRKFTLILGLFIIGLVGCSDESVNASEHGLTEEGVHAALMKCLAAENNSTLVRTFPIYIEGNTAESEIYFNTPGKRYTQKRKLFLRKDIKGDWYLMYVAESCDGLLPLLVE